MIAPWVVREIVSRLAAGATQRRVALECGVSRGTVAGIFNGTRPDYGWIREQREAKRQGAGSRGPAKRCGACGAKAQKPCKACKTRKELKAVGLEVRAARHRGEQIQQLELELEPAEQARYEEVHAEKVRRTAEEAQPDWPEAEFESARVGPVIERIRFVCPCGQFMRAVLIWRPGKPEIIRFQARCRATCEAWLNSPHCPACHKDFSRVTPGQFRAEVMATSLPTGNGRPPQGAQGGEAAL